MRVSKDPFSGEKKDLLRKNETPTRNGQPVGCAVIPACRGAHTVLPNPGYVFCLKIGPDPSARMVPYERKVWDSEFDYDKITDPFIPNRGFRAVVPPMERRD